jgi:hypothetical protein
MVDSLVVGHSWKREKRTNPATKDRRPAELAGKLVMNGSLRGPTALDDLPLGAGSHSGS